MEVKRMERHMKDECVRVYMDTFSKEPWNDVYESKEPVENYFDNFFDNNYFLGYVIVEDDKIEGISVGMKKPWYGGVEYYIDELCVSYEKQGTGMGSFFLDKIEENLKDQGLNGIILNTDKDFPAFDFYVKNGFELSASLRIFVKEF